MQNYDENTNIQQISKFKYFGDQIANHYPMKLEEEEEVDYDEIEELKKKQKQLKEKLLSKTEITDVDKKKKDTSH